MDREGRLSMSSDRPPEGQPRDQAELQSQPSVDPRIEARRNDVESRRRLRLWITAGVVVVLLAAGYGITQSPLLDVDEVEVVGARRTSVTQVLEAAGIESGTPLLGLGLSSSRKSIAALPWVDQVRSSRAWGGKVTFEVTEREPVAQIRGDAGWALIDPLGRVLQVNPAPGNLPIVLFDPVPEPGGWLFDSALPLLEASEALMALDRSDIGSISRVDGQVTVDLVDGGQAHWGGRDDPHGKAAALATVLAKVDLRCLEKADLSVPEFPVLTRYDDCP